MNNKEFEKKLIETLPFKTDVVGQLSREWLLILEKELSQDNSVQINSFGIFELKKKSERITKHPSTKKRILIPPKLTLVFSPSKLIKSVIKKINPHE